MASQLPKSLVLVCLALFWPRLTGAAMFAEEEAEGMVQDETCFMQVGISKPEPVQEPLVTEIQKAIIKIEAEVDTTTMISTGRTTESGWFFPPDYRRVDEAWQWEGKLLFLMIYILFWAMVVLAVQYSGHAATRASTPAATEVNERDALIGAPSRFGPKPVYPQDRLIHDFFLERAQERPADTALIIPEDLGVSRSVVTYGQLEEAISQLARTLSQLGVQRGKVVALCMQRSCAQVVAVHAVLVAGGGYLPIDSEMPESRLRLILGDSGASALLADDKNILCGNMAAKLSVPLVSLEGSGAPGAFKLHLNGAKEDKENVSSSRPQAEDLAMLIYTSGSTGKPKGIIYDHTHLLHGAWFWAEEHSITDQSVLFLKSPYFWAVIEWEMFPALMKGGSLVIASPQGHKNPEYMTRIIKQEGVTTLMITPSVLDLVLDVHQAQAQVPLGSLEHITTVGEPLPTDVANRAATMTGMKATIRNFYGASESGCTIYCVPQAGVDMELFPGKVPAGLPQPHTEVHLMAAGVRPFQPVKDGQEGEICFGGVLAAGYFKLPEMTEKSFVHSPEYGRIYATGDLGRWRGGVLEVIGRIDRQVKVNGVRIEPGEIESVLRKFSAPAEDAVDAEAAPSIKASAVTVKQAAVVATSEPAALVAFVSLPEGVKALKPADLQQHCSENLAQAYVPKHYVVMKEGLPLLPNGKINYPKLKELADSYHMEAQEQVLDSLGQMRSVSKWAIMENEIIHRCYAFWMLGVLTDHYAWCGLLHDPNDPASLLPVCNALALKEVRPWSDVLIRSLGNDQDLFGFIMLGAYQDSRPEQKGKKKDMTLNWTDLYMFGLNLFAALPLPQIMYFITGGWAWPNRTWAALREFGHGPQPSNWFGLDYMLNSPLVAAPRWYLLMIVHAKIFVHLCGCLCVPPWLQVVVSALASWLGAAYGFEFCINTDISPAVKFSLAWVMDSCYVWIRWRWCYMTFYVLCFHYLRPFVTWGTQRIPKGTAWAVAATGASMTLGVMMALFHYPNSLLESEAGHSGTLSALLEVSVSTVQPALFVLGTSCWTWNAAWWGNTTLGCYMIHFVFRDRFTELFRYLARALAWDFTGLLLPASIICACLAFTSTIGPLAHFVLISPQLWLSKMFSRKTPSSK